VQKADKNGVTKSQQNGMRQIGLRLCMTRVKERKNRQLSADQCRCKSGESGESGELQRQKIIRACQAANAL